MKLWAHLARRLVPEKAGEFEPVATLLLLAYVASSPDTPIPIEQVVAALSDLGWRHRDGRPLEGYEIYRLEVCNTLVNVAAKQAQLGDRNWMSRAAAALTWAALRRRL